MSDTQTEARLIRDIPVTLAGRPARLLYVDTGEPEHTFVCYRGRTALASKALEDAPASALRGLVSERITRTIGESTDRRVAIADALGGEWDDPRVLQIERYLTEMGVER